LFCGFAAKGYFGAIHLENAGIAAWGGKPGCNLRTGQKSEFHKPASVITWEVDAVQDRCVPTSEV